MFASLPSARGLRESFEVSCFHRGEKYKKCSLFKNQFERGGQRASAISCVHFAAMASNIKVEETTEVMMCKNTEEVVDFEPGLMYCIATNESDSSGDGDDASAAKIMRSHGVDFVRQPCKARGVSIKPSQHPHVARFAYIDIPLGTMHGTVLSCCHPVCISSGRRFRYCTHCQTAVAKRNFNVRHNHGSLNSPPPKADKIVSDVESDGDKAANGVEGQITESAIPTLIAVDEYKSIKRATGKDDTATMVALNSQELEMINLLRCRPGDDYPEEVEQWKQSLLSMAEKPCKSTSGTPSPPVTMSGGDPDLPFTGDDDDDDDVVSFCMEDFQNVDFASFFEA